MRSIVSNKDINCAIVGTGQEKFGEKRYLLTSIVDGGCAEIRVLSLNLGSERSILTE